MGRLKNHSSTSARVERPTAKKTLEKKSENRFKDEVYREMFLLESHRPGSEMGLALALLRAVVQDSLGRQREFQRWVKAVCPIGLRMIEASLVERSKEDSRS